MRTAYVSDVIRSAKFDVDVGKWKVGHIPRAAFPLSKVRSKSYKFGPDYHWRVVSFETSRGKFRILIVVNESKLICRSTLALERPDGDLAVLCQHEFHESEPGWHCHVTFENFASIPTGAARSHLKKWPRFNSNTATSSTNIIVSSALSFAAARFKFSAQGDLL